MDQAARASFPFSLVPPTLFLFVGFSEPLLISFLPPATPEIRKTGSTMRPRVPKGHRLAPGGPAHPARHRLGHTTAPSSIEKHSVLPPISYTTSDHLSFIQPILLTYTNKPCQVEYMRHVQMAPNIAFGCAPLHPPCTHSLTLSSIVHGSLTGPSPAR